MFPLSVEKFSELFSKEQVWLYLGISFINALLLFFASMKFLLALQQSGYKGNRYFTWLASKETPYLSRLMLLCLLGFLFFCVLNTSFSAVITNVSVLSFFGFLSYITFTLLYIKSESSINAKVPLKKTKRLVRLCITYVLLLTAVSFGFITLLNYLAFLIKSEMVALLRFALICGMPILTPYILFVAHLINGPLENTIKKYYLNKARERLNNSEVLKIGITGSFGKTSVKEILTTLLSQKYRVLATPQSYNTPMGIAITSQKLDSTHDVFIAEMGARAKGDIKELSQLVKPTFAVLTGINNQHLETFGSLENIKSTKYELFENLDKDGIGFFSLDNDGAKELFEKFDKTKYGAGIENSDNLVWASDIVIDNQGTSFVLNFKDDESVKCQTVLLGKHSVSNICLASSVAYKVGLTPQEIASGINRITSIGHRLELVPNNKNIVIIDDSYNSNVDGASAAMEVLSCFKGRKIVLTPGLVELGKMENVSNFELGRKIASTCDLAIVIGTHNAEMLIKGLKDGGMPATNISFAKTLNKGNELLNTMLKEGDVVLFLNDLPDNYS